MRAMQLIAADELFEMGSDSGYELIRGELVPLPLAGFLSSTLTARIMSTLGIHVYEKQLGNITGPDGGYILTHNPDTVMVPDTAFVRADRLPPIEDQRKFLDLAPDLVVEVISESDRYTDVSRRISLYLSAGVQVIWIVDRSCKTVNVYSRSFPCKMLTTNDALDGGEVLPDFSVLVSDLFD